MIYFKRAFKQIRNLSTRKYAALEKEDPAMNSLIQKEQYRQKSTLNLIASENFVSSAVLETLGTCLTNKYSEGYPGARYYAGTEIIDKIETLCQKRALGAFGLNPKEWGVNVQPYSGSTANISIFSSVLKPHEKVMGLGLSSGGHLSHGYFSNSKEINISSKFFCSLPYEVNPKTFLVDFELFAQRAKSFFPKLIVVGASAYTRDWEYERFSNVAKETGAILFADISHTSGLIASKVLKNPFEHADIVMTTTHKTLGGPRGALIFFKNALKNKINFSVFPHVQGGPHNNNIAAIAVQLAKVNTKEFKDHSKQIVCNAKTLSKSLGEEGFDILTGGTDNHQVILNLKKEGISGSVFEKMCEKVNIILNKNVIFGDLSALKPSGVRMGTAAMTGRGFKEKDFERVSGYIKKALVIVKGIAREKNHNEREILAYLNENDFPDLKKPVRDFCLKFTAPGIDEF